MDDIEVQKKQRPKKATRKKTDMCSRSNVLKKLIHSLENGHHKHMIYWDDRMKKQFTIKFVHMNNPEFRNADYLELFKELDKLSNKKYLLDKKYNHECKVRCKANLKKLVDSKALDFMGNSYIGKSIQLRKYKLNYDVSSVKNAVSKGVKMSRRVNDTVQGITFIKGKHKIENLSNEQSHCLCLSKPNSTNLAGPTLSDTCTAENRNGVTRYVIPQTQSLAVYDHEKKMDGNDAIVVIPNIAFNSSSAKDSYLEENKCELIENSNLQDNKMHRILEFQNGALPTYCTKSLSMESIRKFVTPNCNGAFEATTVENLDGTNVIYPGYNDLGCSGYSPIVLQNEDFQEVNGETKNFAQLVPYSPQNMYGIQNDPLLEWCDDYSRTIDKPLQQDKDPLWFDTFTECVYNNPLEDENQMENNEFQECFSFGNMDSSGSV